MSDQVLQDVQVSTMLWGTMGEYPRDFLEAKAKARIAEVLNEMREQGGEMAQMAETLDAAFLVYALAQDEVWDGMARQTILEMMPLLMVG